MKRLLLLFLSFSLLTLPVIQASAQPVLTAEQKTAVYEKLFDRTENQFEKLQKFTTKKLFKKDGRFDEGTWDRFAKEWDEDNMFIKTEAKSYSGWDPIVYENFNLTLRSLTVLGYEYRRFFYAEMATMEKIKEYTDQYDQALEALRFEIDYLKQKSKLDTTYSN